MTSRGSESVPTEDFGPSIQKRGFSALRREPDRKLILTPCKRSKKTQFSPMLRCDRMERFGGRATMIRRRATPKIGAANRGILRAAIRLLIQTRGLRFRSNNLPLILLNGKNRKEYPSPRSYSAHGGKSWCRWCINLSIGSMELFSGLRWLQKRLQPQRVPWA